MFNVVPYMPFVGCLHDGIAQVLKHFWFRRPVFDLNLSVLAESIVF